MILLRLVPTLFEINQQVLINRKRSILVPLILPYVCSFSCSGDNTLCRIISSLVNYEQVSTRVLFLVTECCRKLLCFCRIIGEQPVSFTLLKHMPFVVFLIPSLEHIRDLRNCERIIEYERAIA